MQMPRELCAAGLHRQKIFQYDTGVYDFGACLREVLGLPDGTALSRLHENRDVEASKLIDKWNSISRQHSFHNSRFVRTLTQFMRDVVLPGMHGGGGGATLVYQARPSLRVQLPGRCGIRLHTDRDYHHQPAEVNWWLPLTPTFDTNTLWLESAPGAGDYSPQTLAPGEVLRFYGNACRHYTETNATCATRVSFDVRVCRRDMFDPDSPVSRHPGTGQQRFALGGYYTELPTAVPAPGRTEVTQGAAEEGMARPRKPSKAWRVYRERFLSRVMAQLSLPEAVDDEAAAQLEVALGDAARRGTAPSFTHAGARSGYTAKHLPARAGHLANLLMLDSPAVLPRVREAVFPLSGNHGALPGDTGGAAPVVVSVGGGPGFDAVGAAMVAAFLSSRPPRPSPSDQTPGPQSASAQLPLTHVFDNEPGWGACVKAVERSLVATEPFDSASVSSSEGSVRFDTADILLPLDHGLNTAVSSAVPRADLIVFAHVVVENALGLQSSNWAFLRGSMRAAKDGAAFVFTDNTHRLWPAITDIAAEEGKFEASVPRVHGKHGYSLVLLKTAPSRPQDASQSQQPSVSAVEATAPQPLRCTLEPYEATLLERFREDYARWAASRLLQCEPT